MKKLLGKVVLIVWILAASACTTNPPSIRKVPPQDAPWLAQPTSAGSQFLSIATISPTQTPVGGGRGKLAVLRETFSVMEFCLLEIGDTEWECEKLDISEDSQPGDEIAAKIIADNPKIPFTVYRINLDRTEFCLRDIFKAKIECAVLDIPRGEYIDLVSSSFSPDLSAYVATEWGPYRLGLVGVLYVVRTDGSGWFKFTEFPQFPFSYIWAKDSQKLFFTEKVQGIFITNQINLDGNGLSPTNFDGSLDFGEFSPDDTKIVYTKKISENSTLFNFYLYDFETDESKLISTNYPSNVANYNVPNSAWSPDGKYILIPLRNRNFLEYFVYDLAEDEIIQLTDHRLGHVGYGIWSSDSEQIVYRAQEAVGEFDTWKDFLYVVNVDGSDQKLIAQEDGPSVDIRPLTWSPDDAHIYFRKGSYAYILNVESLESQQILTPNEMVFDPVWLECLGFLNTCE